MVESYFLAIFPTSAAPSWLQELEDTDIDIMSSLTWRCEAESVYDITYEWYRNAQLINTGFDRISFSDNFRTATFTSLEVCRVGRIIGFLTRGINSYLCWSLPVSQTISPLSHLSYHLSIDPYVFISLFCVPPPVSPSNLHFSFCLWLSWLWQDLLV